MSTLDEHDEKVKVMVEAANQATEIFVIDGNFSLVDQGLGRLETSLPPGLYKIKFKAGSVIEEVHRVIAMGSGPVRVIGPEMRFSTSAPLSQTRTTREHHQHSATQLSRNVHHRLGQGSQLFVFGRDLESAPPKNVGLGLSLCNLGGETLVDLSRQSSQNSEQRWAGCTVEVDPGTYRLRLKVGATGVLEQTLVASPGWQTQVFWLRRDYGPSRPVRRADLANASILMAPIGRGFNPDRDDLRYTELARLGLINGRAVVPAEDLRQMLWAKHENPMLGILGAHMLLLATEPDIELLRTVVINLRRLVGEHPDVQALTLWLGEDTPSFKTPPMLRSSWRLIVQATATTPELVPVSSLAAQIADRLLGDGAWLVWENPMDEAAVEEWASPEYELNLYQALAEVAEATVRDRKVVETILEKGDLTDLEESLLRYALKAAQSPKMIFGEAQTGITKSWMGIPLIARDKVIGLISVDHIEAKDDLPRIETDLVQTLGLPYTVILRSLVRLNQKVQLIGEKPPRWNIGVGIPVPRGQLQLERQPTDLVALTQRNVALNRVLAEKKQIGLEFYGDEDLPEIMLDAAMIGQVLNNLIANAVKFSSPGSAVEIRVAGHKDEVVISVRDQGEDIQLSSQSFKASAGIVEEHQGRIWVKRQVGQGTTLYITLPLG